ncbi:peptidoglycan DD-metalloendopeptidase family protein [Bacillus sp. JJ1122]|uniref:murein hydrolase activator EnvC family protein n=1 Tax=Bacillus sp. JJ1122 TaxID=3122951 RepID=UPI002FFFE826
MKKQILSLAVVSTLSLGSLVSPITFDHVSAANISDLKAQKDKLENQRSGVNQQIKQKTNKIGELQTEQNSIEAQVERLDLAVEDATNKITAKNAEIEATNKEIEVLKGEIVVLEERIAKRNELLKDRARSLQLSGGTVSYMDVLLGAQSFSDFIDRVSAVTTIVQADKDILEQHEKDKKELETKQQQVESKLALLQRMKQDLVGLKDGLNAKIREKNKLMAKLKREEKQLHTENLNLQEQNEILAAQSSAIQKAIQLEQERQAAAAAERARQAELARQRAAQQSKSKNSGGGGSSTPAVQQSAPPVSNGMFMWPANGRLSSGLGTRWGEFHAGIDIANKASGVPVVAAADGVVIRSYYSSSYGNCIFVAHSINGQVYTTVYAHMSSRIASSGQVVNKGQQIGVMGNTGQSFGQHLHFELHKGEWNAAKSNAIDPIPYLN